MIDFSTIDYLKTGNIKQQKAYLVLTEFKVMEILKDYSPILTGTIPIEIDVENSDLDICCYWQNKEIFEQTIRKNFGQQKGFFLKQRMNRGFETVIARFEIQGFEIEIFGQNRPVKQQEAYRHMLIEYKLLKAKGQEFKEKIIALKRQGIKTEPAFAKLLDIKEDPYEGLLEFGK